MGLRERAAATHKKANLFLSSQGSVDHGHHPGYAPGMASAISQLSTQETPKVLFTVNHVDKKLKGFVDFDLQLTRPSIPQANAHDQRFEPYNMFPHNFSSTKEPRQVNFDHYQSRENSTIYQVNMSEPLFDREKHLNLIKPKPKGILQFSKIQSKK